MRAQIIDRSHHQEVQFLHFLIWRGEGMNERTASLSSLIIALEWIIRQRGLLQVDKACSPEALCS